MLSLLVRSFLAKNCQQTTAFSPPTLIRVLQKVLPHHPVSLDCQEIHACEPECQGETKKILRQPQEIITRGKWKSHENANRKINRKVLNSKIPARSSWKSFVWVKNSKTWWKNESQLPKSQCQLNHWSFQHQASMKFSSWSRPSMINLVLLSFVVGLGGIPKQNGRRQDETSPRAEWEVICRDTQA